MSHRSPMLVPIVRERARVLAPAVFLGLAFYLVAAEALGIRPGAGAYAADVLVLVVLGALALALVVCRIPDRWIPLASTAVLWCPMLATLIPIGVTGDPIYAVFLIVEIASAGVLLDTALTCGTLIVVNGVAIPMLVVTARGPYTNVLVSCLLTASLFAVIIHLLMRRALIRAETHRLAEAETAHALADRLAELERSESDRMRLQEQLIHSQRMEAVGTLAAGLAHDMNNVLASITGFATLVLEDANDVGVRGDLEKILSQSERGASLTRGLLAFTRRAQYRKQVVRLEEVVRGVVPLLERALPKAIRLEVELALGEACVVGDPVHLEQVLLNLALNSADAMAGNGVLVILGDVVERGGSVRSARFRVSDTGRGMDAATRLRIFEPFFTTKPAGRGTGLGLAVVWGIVSAHEGTIEVDSEPGRGATFTIHIPLTEAAAAPKLARPSTGPIAGKKLVLVVDDEPTMRETTRRLLERMHVGVITAGDGAEALRLFLDESRAIDLVILDMGMPVMGGAECFHRIRAQSTVPVLIATGYAIEAEAQALTAAGAQILEKPFGSEDLKRAVTRLLNGSA